MSGDPSSESLDSAALDSVLGRISAPDAAESSPADPHAGSLGAFGSFHARLTELSGGSAWRPLMVCGARIDASAERHPSVRLEGDGGMAVGIECAERGIDGGARLLVMVDDDTVGANTRAIIGVIARRDAAALTPPRADDVEWMLEVGQVRDAIRRGRRHRAHPLDLLAALPSPVSCGAGVLLAAAARRTPVLLDGVTSLAAAMVAARLSHRGRPWWIASHRPADRSADVALDWLDLEPVVDLGISSGGIGSVLVLRMLTP